MTPEALAAKIEDEREWSPRTAALRDAILCQFTRRLDDLAQMHPEKLGTAISIVVQAGPGRTMLVISDPAAGDLVKELQRYAEEGEPSPLAALLQARVPI